MTDSLSVADVMALQNRDNCCYNNGNAGFGNWGDGGWIFLLFILLIAGRGWGGYGGFGGGFGGYGIGANTPNFQGYATRADINEGFAFNGLERNVQGIQQGICDSTYALNNSIMNGFHGVDNAVCQLGYQTQQGINSLASQMASCCCNITGGQKDIMYSIATQANGINNSIQGVRYDLATQSCDTRNLIQNTTRDIIDGQNANTRAILDFLTQDKISSLQAENQALKFKASQSEQNSFIAANQAAQTAELIRRLGKDCPQPAFLVPDPNCCYGPFGNFYNGNGYNNCGCGCNSCC